MNQVLHLLTGPTASGKSSAAVVLAQLMNAEIVSIDSMAIYRGMDIGTAKPPPPIRNLVPHHLIDIVAPSETFSVAQFISLARKTIADIRARGRAPLLVGGTPMYIRALLSGLFEGPAADWALRRELHEVADSPEHGPLELHAKLAQADPDAARRLHPHDVKRVVRALEVHAKIGKPISQLQRQWKSETPFGESVHLLALSRNSDDLRRRINQRVDEMFERGLVDEVMRLLQRPGGLGRTARAAVGYAETIQYIKGILPLAETIDSVKKRTWRVARKQLTWLRHFPGVTWVEMTPEETPQNVGEALYKLVENWHNHAPVMGLGTAH